MSFQHPQADNLRLPCHTRAILFDLDDTLYDRRAAFRRWAWSFVDLHFQYDHSPFKEVVVDLLVSLDGDGYTERRDLFTEFQRVYPSLYDVSAQIEIYYREFRQHIETPPEIALLPVVLDRLGIPFGIVTNGAVRVQMPKIKALRLDMLASAILISEEFGGEKPASSIFLEAAARLQVPPEEVLFVGDNPVKDIWGAHQVGMKTLWFKRFLDWPETLTRCADITVHSYDELAWSFIAS